MQSSKELGLPFTVDSEDGISYGVEAFRANLKNVEFLWQIAEKYDILHSDQTRGDKTAFIRHLLDPGNVLLLVTTLEDNATPIGLLCIDSIRPGIDATGHYLFWDKVQKGRHRVIMRGMEWFFNTFKFQRLNLELHQHAYSALRRVWKMGMQFEGVKRKSFLYRGKWVDKYTFGILREELTEKVIEEGRFEISKFNGSWYGLLGKNAILRRAIHRRKNVERTRPNHSRPISARSAAAADRSSRYPSTAIIRRGSRSVSTDVHGTS